MINQNKLFQHIETDFGVTKPLFLNTTDGWYDNHLVFAKNLTQLSIGRYRIDADSNSKGVQEFWFDFEWSKFDENNNPILVITQALVRKRFCILQAVLMHFVKSLKQRLVSLDTVYVRVTGMGFHLFFFVQGISKEQWLEMTQQLLKEADIPNTKGKAYLVYGIDHDSVISVRKKIRETYSPNLEKLNLKKEVDYLHYCSCYTLSDFLELTAYPFVERLQDVVAPERYVLSTLQGYAPVPSAPLILRETSGYPTTAVERVKECPALMRILQEPETRVWQARHFLAKNLRYLFKMNEEEMIRFLAAENKWNDYVPTVTQMYVHRHFTEGRNETQVKKPIKKSTLMRYGYCLNDCPSCVYNKY